MRCNLVLLLLAGTSAFVGAGASAATPDAKDGQGSEIRAAAESPASADAAATLGEILVTAQKRSENLQTTPVDVQAFSRQQLKAAGVLTVDDLGQITSGLTLEFGAGVTEFNLRGIAQFSSTVAVESDTPLYIDGVYRPAVSAAQMSLDDASNIEVDKGPQGTLFGRNAIGGAIQITTRDPSFQTPALEATFGYGNYSTYMGSLYASVPVTSNLAGNVDIYYNDQQGFLGTNLWNNTGIERGSEFSVTTKWVYANNDTRVTLEAYYDRNIPAVGVVGSLLSGLYNFFPFNYGQKHIGGFWDTYMPVDDYDRVTQFGGSVKLQQDFHWAQLVSTSAYEQVDSFQIQFVPLIPAYETPLGAGIFPASGYVNGDHDQHDYTFTQEVDLLSPDSSRIKWTVGVFYMNNTPTAEPQGGGTIFDKTFTNSVAVYGQATVPIFNDQNHLTGGYRFTYDAARIVGDEFFTAGGALEFTQANNPQPSDHWTNSSYKVEFDHEFSRDIMAYVSNTTGYQAGFYNLTSGPQAPPSLPETIMSTEVGVTSLLLNETLRLNVSGYYYTANNLIATFVTVNPVNGTLHTMVENAARTQDYGIDVEADYKPPFVPGLTLSANLSAQDPTYLSFNNAEFLKESGNGLTWTFFVGNATGNYVQGDELFIGNVGAIYTVPLADRGNLEFSTNVSYHSGEESDQANINHPFPYTIVNATARWTSVDGRYTVSLWGKNLANTEYFTVGGVGASQSTYYPEMPRTFGVTVGYRFH